MSIYSHVDSGISNFRSKIPSRDRWCGTVDFFRLYGAQCRFLVPGDIWKEVANCFIRLNPMLTPSLTPMSATIRWFYVPLRLVEPDKTELIITGSKDGKLSEETLPAFSHIMSEIDIATQCTYDDGNAIYVNPDSILHVIFEVPAGYYNKTEGGVLNGDDASLPRLYWLKAYCRIWWDYYRDENLSITLTTTPHPDDDYAAPVKTYQIGDDFDDFFQFVSKYCHCLRCLPTCLGKDYFTSSLPWQLKGATPTIQMNVSAGGLNWTDLTSADDVRQNEQYTKAVGFDTAGSAVAKSSGLVTEATGISIPQLNDNIQRFLDHIAVSGSAGLEFDVSQLRDLFAQTRVFERLARTGSRYIEYLRANFNTAPSDGTLQRAQYIGGFKQSVLTTEVLQTGVGDTPVGTMRGHGISNATNTMPHFINKEFGMLFATFEIRPRIQYTQGIRRELTYASRYDFYNPSFQRLSEQEVRKGEIYFSDDNKNDETFGFQGMYNELRSGKERFFGEMLNTQAQWNQAIKFSSRPSLNGAFINGTNYASSWLRPFGLNAESETTKPVIVDLYFTNSPYRPMVKNPVPGLIDHD